MAVKKQSMAIQGICIFGIVSGVSSEVPLLELPELADGEESPGGSPEPPTPLKRLRHAGACAPT